MEVDAQQFSQGIENVLSHLMENVSGSKEQNYGFGGSRISYGEALSGLSSAIQTLSDRILSHANDYGFVGVQKQWATLGRTAAVDILPVLRSEVTGKILALAQFVKGRDLISPQGKVYEEDEGIDEAALRESSELLGLDECPFSTEAMRQMQVFADFDRTGKGMLSLAYVTDIQIPPGADFRQAFVPGPRLEKYPIEYFTPERLNQLVKTESSESGAPAQVRLRRAFNRFVKGCDTEGRAIDDLDCLRNDPVRFSPASLHALAAHVQRRRQAEVPQALYNSVLQSIHRSIEHLDDAMSLTSPRTHRHPIEWGETRDHLFSRLNSVAKKALHLLSVGQSDWPDQFKDDINVVDAQPVSVRFKWRGQCHMREIRHCEDVETAVALGILESSMGDDGSVAQLLIPADGIYIKVKQLSTAEFGPRDLVLADCKVIGAPPSSPR